MRRAARSLIRSVAFLLLRASRVLERSSRRLAAATFTRAEVESLTIAEWESFALNSKENAGHSFPWEVDLFARFVRADDVLLVIGAGSGRDVFPFLESGHRVTALDIAPHALDALHAEASRRGLPVQIVPASITSAELAQGAFDVIVFSWFCYAYVQGRQARQAALIRVAATLRPGGRILISYPRRGRTRDRELRESRVARWIARALGGVEPESGDLFNVGGSAASPTLMISHAFGADDIEAEARAAGLDVGYQAQPTTDVGVIVLTSAARPLAPAQ